MVGRVQSGKTANFTGVIAKAIDAGYRLVIVLTGTLELLRSQTQRRLDMELVGEENILGGIPRDDLELLRGVDYAGTGDRDWQAGKFVRYGHRPRDVGAPTSDGSRAPRPTTASSSRASTRSTSDPAASSATRPSPCGTRTTSSARTCASRC